MLDRLTYGCRTSRSKGFFTFAEEDPGSIPGDGILELELSTLLCSSCDVPEGCELPMSVLYALGTARIAYVDVEENPKVRFFRVPHSPTCTSIALTAFSLFAQELTIILCDRSFSFVSIPSRQYTTTCLVVLYYLYACEYVAWKALMSLCDTCPLYIFFSREFPFRYDNVVHGVGCFNFPSSADERSRRVTLSQVIYSTCRDQT